MRVQLFSVFSCSMCHEKHDGNKEEEMGMEMTS